MRMPSQRQVPTLTDRVPLSAIKSAYIRHAQAAKTREERVKWMRLYASVSPMRQMGLPL